MIPGETLIVLIARKFDAYKNCIKTNNQEWEGKHAISIEFLVDTYLPHGSGFDNGTSFEFASSRKNRLVFHTGFHHMNDAGYYDGWTEHDVIVIPDLAMRFELRITGKDKNNIKDYIGHCFYETLSKKLDNEQVLKASAT